MPTPISPASSTTPAISNSSSAAVRISCASPASTTPSLAGGSQGEKIVWIVRRMEIDFIRSARMDDILTIDTRTEKISGARITMAQELRRGDEVLVTARVEAAIIGELGRPRRFPKEWVAAFMPRE